MCKVRRREESYMALACKPAAALVCVVVESGVQDVRTNDTAPHTARCSVCSGMRRRKQLSVDSTIQN